MSRTLRDQLAAHFEPPREQITPWNPSRRATARVPDPLPAPTHCPHCGRPIQIVNNRAIYGKEYGDWPWAFWCKPCDAYVGLHPFTGIPLGTLATRPLRDARKKAKALFNELWQSGEMTRSAAYAWASKTLQLPPKETHVAMFDIATCNRLIEEIRKR